MTLVPWHILLATVKVFLHFGAHSAGSKSVCKIKVFNEASMHLEVLAMEEASAVVEESLCSDGDKSKENVIKKQPSISHLPSEVEHNHIIFLDPGTLFCYTH